MILELITEYDAISDAKRVTGVILPRRKPDTHKYNYGCDMVVGGCVGYTGAPMYAAEAASRAGAGLCMLGVPEKIYAIEAVKADSAMPFPLPCDEDGKLVSSALSALESRFPKTDALLIGPGMGQSVEIKKLVHSLIASFPKQIVLDADGINALSANIDTIGLSKRPMILTPHAGEFKRIGGDTTVSPVIAARKYAVKHGCILVLKGHRTVTAMPDGEVFLNTTGSPALSKGGSGDVLAGIILAFIGQGFSPRDAVPAAVYLHGLCGDICERKLHEYSVLPSDVIASLPEAFHQSLMR